MLSDRSYMRDEYRSQKTSVLIWLLSSLTGGFIVQLFLHRAFAPPTGRIFDAIFELSIDGLQHGQLWGLVSYGFLHDTGPLVLLHLLVNCLLTWVIGRELLPILGSRRFLGFWFFALLMGGLLWTATNWRFHGSLIGASSAVAGLIALHGLLNPNQRVTLLLLFIPVTFVMKYAVLTLLGIELIGFFLFELVGKTSGFGWEHSAHLGGMFAGWAYFRFVHQREWQNPDGRVEVELPKWFKRAHAEPDAPAPAKVNVVSREDMKAEVDRILDKINSEGFSSLTLEERQVLDNARDVLSKP